MRGSSLKQIEKVAERLGAEVAFLGGATIELLLTDSAAEEVRVTMERGRHHSGALASRLPGEFRGALARTGISGRGRRRPPWKTGELVVDVMPVEPEILGFSNRWYPGALGKARAYELPSGTEIQLVTAPYVLATKIEAFLGRGGGDYLMSHDVGDVIALVDGREELVVEVAAEPRALRSYLSERLLAWLADGRFNLLVVSGHLPFEGGRVDIVLERLRAIVDAGASRRRARLSAKKAEEVRTATRIGSRACPNV